MIESAPQPSRWLQWLAALARWSLRLLLAAWLLLIVAVAAWHAAIVPRIGELRPWLQARAQQALGAPLEIGAIAARPGWLIPSIELTDLTLPGAAGRAALRLPRVVLTLSPRSLLRRGFDQLYIERPEIEVRRGGDGRITVASFDLAQLQGVDGDKASGGALADWLFAQGEVVVSGGSVHWVDEQQSGAQAPALTQVDLLLRNGNWQHRLRLDATPPPAFGERFRLVALLRAPLLRAGDGNWRHWNGQLFADCARIDLALADGVARLLRPQGQADPGHTLSQGRAALRAWAELRGGQIVGATADLALADLNARLGPGLPPLALSAMQGRLSGRRVDGALELSTQALQFQTADGLRWPGGNLRLLHRAASSQTPAQGEFDADRIDLAALAQLALRLPLGAPLQDALRSHAPRGLVDEVHASWQGPPEDPAQYRLRGRVHGLALAADARQAAASRLGFGLRGAALDFDMNQSGGRAALSIADGALLLPGVFEDPLLPLSRLGATLRWQIDAGPGKGQARRIAVQSEDLHFANADAQGQARLSWRSGDGGAQRARFPGVLDLTGSLSRAEGRRVHRYLPLLIPEATRRYVRDAIVSGSAGPVQFRVRGALDEMPFDDPRQGEFRIAARVKDLTYAYAPPALQSAGAPPWPVLSGLGGELIFERSAMQVRNASSAVAGSKGLRLSRVEASIPDLSQTVVGVSAEASGPLAEWLALLAHSPLARLSGNALDQASGSGNADLQLRLSLPIDDLRKSRVQGNVALAGNDLRITPEQPTLSRLRGAVQFSDNGFSLNNLQAQALGGALRIDGGLRAPPANNGGNAEAFVQLRAQGTASAEGLQSAQLGLLSRLARHATGSAPYTLALGFRRGQPEWQISSSLQGMALALPAPLGKSAETSLPLRFATEWLRESPPGAALREQITLELGALGALGFATYQREPGGAQTRVLRGAIGIGLAPGESAPLPVQGVAANVRYDSIDLDAWQELLAQTAPPPANDASAAPGANPAQDYLPSTLALRARSLTLHGQQLHEVVAGATRAGQTWRANLESVELGGYLEYRAPAASARPEAAQGRVFARLSRVDLPQGDGEDSEDSEPGEALFDKPGQGQLPALDIVVDDFGWRGKRLGRVEIEARNQGEAGQRREWRLDQFNILAPEASLSASGVWAAAAADAARPGARRTQLDFVLDVRDSGELLARLGMPQLLRGGQGRIDGRLTWNGAPLSPDYRSMAGQLRLALASGQFLKAEPGLAKLLGVLSLQSLPRRLALDFRDVFSEGFVFDFVRGDVQVERGLARTNNLQMKGVNAAVLMEGSADIERETQNLRVVVVPEINAMTASLVATAINPVLGLGSFLAQVFLRGPLAEAATQEFHIDGSWAEPRVVRVSRRAASPAGETAPTSGNGR